jgi:hypothetical protein
MATGNTNGKSLDVGVMDEAAISGSPGGSGETLMDLCSDSDSTLQALANSMNALDRKAPKTHARISQILRESCNSVPTLRVLARVLGVPIARVYAANDETHRRFVLSKESPQRVPRHSSK